MKPKIRLAMCDDMNSYCHYLQRSFSKSEDIEIVGVANSAKECILMVEKCMPDVLLLDVQMERETSGIEIIPALLKSSPDTKIIILTIHYEENLVFKALTYGAVDYAIKSESDDELIELVRKTYNNIPTLSNKTIQAIINEGAKIKQQNSSLMYMINTVAKLTKSELNILYDLHLGLSYREIAKKRYVEEITIRSQVSRILKKFDESNIKEIVKSLDELQFFENVKI